TLPRDRAALLVHRGEGETTGVPEFVVDDFDLAETRRQQHLLRNAGGRPPAERFEDRLVVDCYRDLVVRNDVERRSEQTARLVVEVTRQVCDSRSPKDLLRSCRELTRHVQIS